jgi:putative ABC transport system substrate-binding protein
MRRRDFMTLAAGAAATLGPLAARAQQPAMPVVGYLYSGSPDSMAFLVNEFRKGLNEAGFFEGRNVTVEYRWADGHYDRLPALAADLVRRQVTVIVATGGQTSALAAKAATTTIPIVFTTGGDPVKTGLVKSLSHPGGNATGFSQITTALEAKRLELLREVVPKAGLIAVLVNPNYADVVTQIADVEAAARAMERQVLVLKASSEAGIAAAFATLTERRAGGLLVGSDPYLFGRRDQIIGLAARHALPAIYNWREFADAGGLMSYGTRREEVHRQSGLYTGRVLKGEKPADLPVQLVTKIELVINLKTAKVLGITFPLTLLGRADEVIE